MARKSLNNVARLIDIAEKKVPVEEQFRLDLSRSIELNDKKGWRLPSKTFKPSSMNCKRNSYYQIMGTPPDAGESSYNSVGIRNAGSDIHERVQGAVSKMLDNNIDCEYVDVARFVAERHLEDIEVREKKGFETKLYNKRYNISFMCDGIIRYNGHYYILEIKTETSHKWYARNGVDPKHYQQAIAYSLSMELPEVIFLYVDRDMLSFKTYLFPVDPGAIQSMKDYIADVQSYVQKQITPPKDENMSKRDCQYCSYKNTCKGDK